jgi:hypothetical protein
LAPGRPPALAGFALAFAGIGTSGSFARLVSTVGAVRASMSMYLVPGYALALGATLLAKACTPNTCRPRRWCWAASRSARLARRWRGRTDRGKGIPPREGHSTCGKEGLPQAMPRTSLRGGGGRPVPPRRGGSGS